MSRYDILLNDPKKETPQKLESPASPPPQENRRGDETAARPVDEQVIRPSDRPTGLRGELVRRGFEWYADQLRALKQLSLQEQMEGKPGSMSAMLREALDDYLKKRAVKK